MKAKLTLDSVRTPAAKADICLDLTESQIQQILRVAGVRASLLVAHSNFTRDEWEDIRQELILDLLRRIKKFDPNRGEWEGFVQGVIANKSTVLHRKKCRQAAARELSLEAVTADGSAECPFASQALTSKPAGDTATRLDLQRAVKAMPLPVRKLAEQLMEMSPTEVCRSTGRSRSGVYQMIRQIRARLVKAGIRPPANCSTVKNSRPPGRRPAEATTRKLLGESPTSIPNIGTASARDLTCRENIQ